MYIFGAPIESEGYGTFLIRESACLITNFSHYYFCRLDSILVIQSLSQNKLVKKAKKVKQGAEGEEIVGTCKQTNSLPCMSDICCIACGLTLIGKYR